MTHVIAGVLLAATVLIAPGLLLARLGGVRGWGAVSAALPLSCAVTGISEVVAAAGGWAWVPWGWAAIAGTTAVAAGVLTVVRRACPGNCVAHVLGVATSSCPARSWSHASSSPWGR